MCIEIQRRDGLAFLLTDAKEFPPAARHFAAAAQRDGDMILEAYCSHRPVGMLAFQKLGGLNDVSYFYVVEGFRRKGVGSALMKKALILSELPVSLRMIRKSQSSAALERLASGCGLEPVNSAGIYHCLPCEPETRRTWFSFCAERGERLCRRIMNADRRIVRFEDASVQMMDGLFRLPDSEFHLRCERMDPHYSRLLVEGSKALSFVGATLHENRIIVELAGVRRELRNTGLFFPPLSQLIQEAIEERVRLVIFTVYDGNRAMGKLTDGFLSPLISSKKEQVFYRRDPIFMK